MKKYGITQLGIKSSHLPFHLAKFASPGVLLNSVFLILPNISSSYPCQQQQKWYHCNQFCEHNRCFPTMAWKYVVPQNVFQKKK